MPRNQPVKALTRADLIALWRRVCPVGYTDPMETGPGMPVVTAIADVMARASSAVTRSDTDYRLDTAPGGSFATAILSVTRSGSIAAALDIAEGSTFQADDGTLFVVPAGSLPVSWGAGVGGTKLVSVRSVRQSYQANVRAGTINTAVAISPSGQTTGTLTVTNTAAAAGGVTDTLSAVASNRAAYRRVGESTEDFRARAKALTDGVSPAAIRRLLDRHCKPAGLTYRLLEGHNLGLACDDGCCDDPSTRPEDMMAPDPSRGYFVAVLKNGSAKLPGHSGAFCDDGACDYSSSDGGPWQWDAFTSGLKQALDEARMGGVWAGVVMED